MYFLAKNLTWAHSPIEYYFALENNLIVNILGVSEDEGQRSPKPTKTSNPPICQIQRGNFYNSLFFV